MEVRIRDRVYDISDFKHPGGSVIRTHARCASPGSTDPVDATNVFYAFHHRSPRAFRRLRDLPSRRASPFTVDAAASRADAAFDALRTRLVRDGYFRPSARHIAYRLGTVAGMWAGARALVAAGWTGGGLLLFALLYVQCGWVQHECGHKSFTTLPRLDSWLQFVHLNVLMGGNCRFWNSQHFSHHANTQHLDHDKDLKTHPLVAFDERVLRRKPHTVFTRHQHLLYWTVINPIVWFTWSFLSHPVFALRTGHVGEYAVGKAASLWLYAHAFPGFGAATSLLLFHAASLIGSCVLLATFTVSHTPTEAYSDHRGWVRPAAEHTINVPDHWLTNWWMGYLNFQIEHHLFPSMPQFRQARVGVEYVRPFFRSHGLPYQETPFWRANADVYRNLRRVARSRGAAEPSEGSVPSEQKPKPKHS